MSGLPRPSIVIEWSNALLAEADRPARMMAALAAQAGELQSASGQETGGSFPLEVLLCFDSERVDGEAIAGMAPLAAQGRHGPLLVMHCPFPGAEYYDLKNLGAERASGDLLIFLDSDVLPQDGWLSHLWGCFANPDLQVVGGVSSIDPVTLYDKATALNWVFDPPPGWFDIRPAEHFWANNVAFRRTVFAGHPFPGMNGASRGACSHLARILAVNGIPVHVNGSARVLHPSPAGLGGFCQRAMAQGRDRVLWHRRFGSWWMQSAPAGLLRFGKHLSRVVYSGFFRRRQVGLRWWEVPAAIGISAAYYTVFLVGELLTHVAPAYMKRSFRV